MDRRTAYTKKVIKDALYALLQENSLTEITVKEICQKAGINRATFYRHYEDLNDLYESVERELLALPGIGEPGQERMESLLKVIGENQVFYREFFRHHLESASIKQLVAMMYENIARKLRNAGCYNEKNYDVNFVYALCGFVGVVWQWVEDGCVEPAEELAPLLYEIIRQQLFVQK